MWLFGACRWRSAHSHPNAEFRTADAAFKGRPRNLIQCSELLVASRLQISLRILELYEIAYGRQYANFVFIFLVDRCNRLRELFSTILCSRGDGLPKSWHGLHLRRSEKTFPTLLNSIRVRLMEFAEWFRDSRVTSAKRRASRLGGCKPDRPLRPAEPFFSSALCAGSSTDGNSVVDPARSNCK